MIKSEWIRANAGSGKTFTLTGRVVRLLLLGVSPERIVCITYTKAAANEMRGRVLDRLRDLLLADDVLCKKQVEELLGEDPNAEQMQRARSLFATVLDSSGGGLQLTTIHGFCQNILRRFPIEADIAPHFTVLEEAAADEVLRRTKHTLLASMESAEPLVKEALALIGNRGGETRFEMIANDIISKRRMWKRVWHLQSPESLRAHIYDFHELEVGMTRAALAHGLCDSINATDEAVLRAHLPALVAHKTPTYQQFGSGLAAWFECDASGRCALMGELLALFLTDKGEPRKRLLNDKEYPHGSPLREVIQRLAEHAIRFAERAAALACAEETFAVAMLARALLENYEAAKLGSHALDYEDLIDKTLDLCTDPDKLGWVMTKLDHRIDYLLIDEAQDNSPEQWKLAYTLVEELIANNGGTASNGHPRSLLVVGDEKQSIYSFQGAAPEEFHHYHSQFARMLSAGSPSPLISETLSNSYRSTAAVLKLVDHVATQAEVKAALSAIDEVPQHQLTRKDAAGRVVLYPPIIAPEKEANVPLIIPTEYKIAASAPQQLAKMVAETIARWLAEKRPLATGRAMNAGDILILVHRRKPLMQPLIRELQRLHVPVAGIDRLTLADHLAVTDLLALMRWCGNVGDDLALAQVLRSPLIGSSDDALRELAFGRNGILWNEVTSPWLAQLRNLGHLSPYDFLTQVLEVSGKRSDFARRFGEEVHEVLDELKAQATAMPEGMACTQAYFVDWMEKNTRQIKREQEAADSGHVRLMTVHGAKGLEAPVVVLADTVSVPDTGREVSFSRKSAHGQELPLISISEESKAAPLRLLAKDDKQRKLLAEYDRLLYVALTRARDELHIFGTASKKGEVKPNSWYEIVQTSMREIAVEEDELLVLADRRESIDVKAAAKEAAEMPVPDWVNTSAAREIAISTTLSPSGLEVTAATPYAVAASRGARQRGVHIHRILELLKADTNAAQLAKLVKHSASEWDAGEQAAVIANITALFSQEKWLWEHERYTEVNVAGKVAHNGALIPFSGQIDLLVKTPTEIIVLDYKTGTHIPSDASQVSRNYLLQLKVYRELVRQIYPDLPVRCAILWTVAPRLMWLDETVETTQFPSNNVMDKTIVAA